MASLAFLAALAPGFGPGWVKIDRQAAAKPVAIRLVRDDVPIEGRILEPRRPRRAGREGFPSIAIADLPDGFLATLRTDAGQADASELWMDLMGRRLVLDKAGPLAAVRTGPDGRFRMTGVGRDRVVALTVEGESIVESMADVLTTGDPAYKPLSVSIDDSEPFKLVGPRFELAVAPGRVVEGTVRDRDTGRPIPGAKVGSSWAMRRDHQRRPGPIPPHGDAQGRGQSPHGRRRGSALRQGRQAGRRSAGPRAGPGRRRAQARGVGRGEGDQQVERTAGQGDRPVPGVPGQPSCQGLSRGGRSSREPDSTTTEYRTDADGRFRAVALPGGGILVVRSLEPGYLTARPLTPEAAGNVLDPSNFEYSTGPVPGPGADQSARERGLRSSPISP